MDDLPELLFFDTFAHESSEQLNLDLVQFPKPVYVTEVRIIPLGARVQADFPGGVRLGATNPSQFQIEFFVNDLGKPGASTFETLGGFEYNQNGCINLNCTGNDNIRKIPTDGLVLRGWYTTITLAVYGTLTANIAEQIIPAVVTPSIPNQTSAVSEVQQIMTQTSLKSEWPEAIPTVNMEYTQQPATQYPQQYISQEPFQQEYSEYYNEVPKDPRSYHHTPETDWDTKSRVRPIENDRPRDYQKGDADQEHDRRERENRRYSRSHSRDRGTRDFQDTNRDKDWEHDYREHDKDWERDREVDRDSRYKHSDNYRRYSDREERKRPRTPPAVISPKRPYTPHSDHKEPSPPPKEIEASEQNKLIKEEKDVEKVAPVVEENSTIDVEEFEPILSDEDILDDPDNYDYDYSGYTNNDDLIKLFIPGTTTLKKYEKKPAYNIEDNKTTVNDSLINIIPIIDDFFKSSLTRYNLEGFKTLNTDLKEDFVHLCEKVTTVFIDNNNFYVLTEIYMKATDIQNEIVNQVKFIIETLINWVIIALNYEMANAQEQPPYKLRHIKCGVKLAEFCSLSTDFIALLKNRNFFIHTVLLELYEKEYMALSIKLMILKALDTYLLKKSSVEMFLIGTCDNEMNGFHNLTPINEKSGYKIIIELIKRNPLVRLKFSLNCILKKLNLFEALDKIRITVGKLTRNEDYKFTENEIVLLVKNLKYILSLLQSGSFALSQPRRFLPVTAQFEINRSNCNDIIMDFFKMQNVLDVVLLLLTGPDTIVNPNIKMPVYEILAHIAESYDGLNYMAENSEIINVLMKVLLATEEEGGSLEFGGLKSQNLGLNISYKLQCLYHLNFLNDLGNQHNFDCDHPDIIDQLHALLCLTFSNPGKFSCSEVIGMGENMGTLLNFLDFTRFKPDMNKFRKSPGASYIIDLIYAALAYTDNIDLLEKYSKQLLEISSQQELFEEAMSGRLNDISAFVKPYENFSGSYDVPSLIDVINKSLGSVTSFSGNLITTLRILQNIGIPKYVSNSEISVYNPLADFIELKYKHVLLQLFPLEGIIVLGKVLQELCDYYEQPNLHTTTFVSHQGILIINLIIPCVKLIRQMLTYVIQCRNIKFKDLTAINTLLQTYNLCQSFPVSSLGFFKGRKICREIVDILLVYTQPVSEEIHEKDSLNKTLWTLMCGEVIKYTISAPYTFIAGLSVFSEILPLPLPIQTHQKLNEDESSWAVNLRKLWSAHLHPCSSNIQELISKLCTTSYQPLLNLLRKVCAQISDLAANSAIMIARGMLDNVHSAIVIGDDVKKLVCNGHIARLMNFMACLVTHASLKCAFLNLLRNASGGKGDEKYPAIIQAFGQILRSTSNVTSHVQTQECILSILQTFCDTEITLYQNPPIAPEVYLANALPTKENLNMFLTTMFDHITGDNSLITILSAIRTLILLTEHDYGFFHLRECLLRRTAPFNNILIKLETNFHKDSGDCLSTFNTLIEFLRACLEPEEVEGEMAFKPREIKMTIGEVQGLIGWKGKDGTGCPLLRLEEKLKEIIQEDESLGSFLEGLETMLTTLRVDTTEETKETFVEPVLPQPETLLVQFSGRPLYTSANTGDERLTSVFWPTGVCDETDGDVENVTCDLLDICRQDLSPDVNLIKQVEKLCRICSSDNGEQEEKEKRMNMQKDKMRRPFVTPIRGRGFARSIQVRSDLFRSRPPNTSRPPSLHVDDFVALETCGAQPTGPTGYNKISREMLSTTRISRGPRGRAFVASERAVQYRQMSWWGPGPGRAPY